MAFFRGFLLSVFCACISLPAWSAADPACNIIQNFTSKSSADSFANKDIITCHKSGKKGFDFEVTPIEHAIDFNNVEAVRAILQRAPSKASSMVHTNKQTILDYVVQGCAGDKRYRKQEIPREQKRLEIIKLLIENGADVNTVAYDSKATMLDLATYKDRRDGNSENYDWTFCDQIAEVLLEHGAKTYAELNGDASAPGQGNTGTTGTPSSNATGGCTLEFKSNGDRLTKLEHITDAHQVGRCVRPGIECTEVNWSNAGWWTYVDDYEVDGEEPMAKLDSEDDSPFLNDLIKVDGVDVDLVSVFENSADIYFACDKRYRDNYFAIRDCVEGYHGENVLLVGDDGIEYYEKCVKDEGPLDDTELGDNTTVDENSGDESSGDNDTEETPAPNVNVDNSKDIADAESAYSNAKANEQSLANRMLGGATMAATGIGGMQLAQGLAEQSADKAADRDMQAYLATFTCKIGDKGGKSYKGGEMGIEVSGGNQLTSLYQQYVDLAADLKERKNALGMAPGIESTVVMDKANMGLYDATGGSGIENGTYASLYRASKGNDADKQKLAEQKDTSANRVKGGAIAAGGGAIGGVIGNVLINNNDEDETVTEEDCKKVKGTYKDGKCTCPGKDKVYKKGKCVDKSDNNSGLAELGASLGSALGSGVNLGNVASTVSGFMSGSVQ